MQQFAERQTRDGAEHINQFGDGDEAQQKEIDVENVRIVGNEVLLIHQIDGIGYHSEGGEPADEPLTDRILMPPIVQIEIQIGKDDQQQEQIGGTCNHWSGFSTNP